MLTWNEIRTRAAQFAERWADATKENAEAQTFWNEFLAVYGVDRRRVAAFERKVKGLEKGSGRGRIDLLWPGLFMAEHKSKGRDLSEATTQALDYVQVLEPHERPQWIAVSDFGQIRLQDVATGQAEQFPLTDLPKEVERFAFLIGKQLRHQREADPVNVKAAQQMGKLHNLLEDSGYTGHALEVLLVRLLFLLFGDDTGLWDERGLFYDLLADHTRSDGEDTGSVLGRLFQVLDTPNERRQVNLPEWLKAFPYVNGELFKERIDLADFSPKMREMLLDACTLDWGAVSPAIFGSMFQAVMDETERRNLGAHYTSEANILKALGPLFLDELHAQREAARGSKAKLQQFLDLLPRLRFLDPACGSGNFLLLTFRELRRLELDVLLEYLKGQNIFDVKSHLRVNVGQFYGIEYDEFPAQIARVAMWLADHQANIEASRKLGQNFVNLPLNQAAHIHHGDALDVDWLTHLNLEAEAGEVRGVYILGNPPFIGASLMTPAQRQQLLALFHNVHNATELDYVAGWHIKAAKLMNTLHRHWPQIETKTALVSTNSIVQGEQVAPLWSSLLRDQNQVITAAHQTFQWSNDAPGQAAVHCVITQFQPAETAPASRLLFIYSNPKAAPLQQTAKFINAYLVDGPDVIVTKRSAPFPHSSHRMSYGNKPTDNGHLIFQTREEYDTFLREEPGAAPFIKPMLDAHDFINGKTRWCLWLPEADPAELRRLPKVMERVQKVKEFRLRSTAAPTRKTAETPTRFFYVSHPKGPYVAMPRHTSANREYIPLGYLDEHTVINDAMCLVADADLFLFGVMQSRLHMAWMRLVSGRLKSDYRYSPQVTYNTFPWPDRAALTIKQIQAVEKAAQQVLDARTSHPDSTLADLYDPLTMPGDMRAAHNALDRAVDAVYGLSASSTEVQRLALLLKRYQDLVPTLESQARPARRSRK
ncbi:class I SAM-dependent DNA methyltransferase [Deinococcus soli (ex Cha et al. 2016)]|uniref:class I SAM-dependent DNA methyltransferase n=1 Tax=Deinococcus soli (ex Cha et al. 2016) TaxID=1309411 RepID=UPI00166AB915|nr:class I SAM-dependent DNA methyltransferase [Deinococcus soli (ex Cha et al. 2016)]GGB83806.1 methylase [Deinococcus soli (ex Cha et al. 2016)]